MTVPEGPSSTSSPPPLTDALREILADAVRFGRAELNLVRATGIAAGKRGALGAGLVAGAAVAAFVVVLFLLGAAAEGIGGLLGHPWLGWLIMAGLSLVVALLLAYVGYRLLKGAIAEGKRVATTVKEDLEWVRELPRRSAKGS